MQATSNFSPPCIHKLLLHQEVDAVSPPVESGLTCFCQQNAEEVMWCIGASMVWELGCHAVRKPI